MGIKGGDKSMDEYFKGLVERTHYYEQFESFRASQTGYFEETMPGTEEKERKKEVLQTGENIRLNGSAGPI